MTTTTLYHTTELVVVTCWCSMPHAVPKEMRDHQLRRHNEGLQVDGIYCPLGHSHVPAGKSKVTIERERAEAAEAQTMALRDQLAAAERERKRHEARTKNGVCPCCQRSFVQLARHIKTKHPEYAPTPAPKARKRPT
jgi:hypothetical protein